MATKLLNQDSNSKLKYLKLACEIAKQSTQSKKVGCVIVALNTSEPIVSTGYNTFNQHAEVRALYQFKLDTLRLGLGLGLGLGKVSKPFAFHITKFPCEDCVDSLLLFLSNQSRSQLFTLHHIVCPPIYLTNPLTNLPSKWVTTQKKALEKLTQKGIEINFQHIEHTQLGEPYLCEQIVHPHDTSELPEGLRWVSYKPI